MSWWDASGFGSFASQALKQAQKKIDKVLEISAGDENTAEATSPSEKEDSPTSSSSSKSRDDDKGEKSEGAKEGRSSWAMPWSMDSSMLEASLFKSSPEKDKPSKTQSSSPKVPSPSLSSAVQSGKAKDVPKSKGISRKVKKSEKGTNEEEKEVSGPPRDAKQDKGDISRDEASRIAQKDERINLDMNPSQQESDMPEGNNTNLSTVEGTSSVSDITPAKDIEQTFNTSLSQVMSLDEKISVLLPNKSMDTYETISEAQQEKLGLTSENESEVLAPASCESQNIYCSEEKNVTKSYTALESSAVIPPSSTVTDINVSVSASDVKESDATLESVTDVSTFSTVDLEKSLNSTDSKISEVSESASSLEMISSDSAIKIDVSTKLKMDKSHPQQKSNQDVDLTTSGSSSSLEIVQVSEVPTQESSLKVETANDPDVNVQSDLKCDTVIKEEQPYHQMGSEGEPPVHQNDSREEVLHHETETVSVNITGKRETETQGRVTSESALTDSDASRISDISLSPNESSLGGTDSDTNKLDSSMDTYTSDDTVVDRIAKSEDIAESDDHSDRENSKSTLPHDRLDVEEDDEHRSIGSVSPSSSYVKCMIEEAMEDGIKIEDNNSDTHSNGGEKSECSRSTGGHDSGDEFSTTTSSDIEIISTPTPNGDGTKMVDLSPLKIALQKTARRGTSAHKRSDSQSSSSTQSREGHGEQLSPGRDSLEGLDDGNHLDDNRAISEDQKYRQITELSPLNEESSDPYHPQNLLKLQTVPELCELTNSDTNTQKLAETTEILQARETKLVQLSRENLDLIESNSILRNQLQQLEAAREAEMEDISNVNSEFSKRIAESEKKINQVIREKETLKKQLKHAEEELTKKAKDRSLQNLLEEKDVQITELMQEGEKLSKQQLQLNTVIKKLRAKEKENDSLITSQKKKLEEQKSEIEHLRKVCDSKEEMEKKQTDAINQLNSAVQKQEREMSKMKSDLEDSQERVRGLQAALDKSYKEIADLHRSNAAQDSKAQETALSVEMQVREELKAQLGQEQKAFSQEKEALIMQIEDLRLTLSRMEKEHNRREDMLRQEISDLQRHLQEDEARNQELTHSVTSATRPLLRQIENLQSTYTAQSGTWEKLEKNLSDRLGEAQTQLATVVEKERYANEKVMELTTQVTSFESQTSRLKQDKAQLTAQLDVLKAKVEVIGDTKNSEIAQVEAVKHEMSIELADLKKEKVFLETQLEMEKTKLDQEKKKMAIAQDQISQLEREAQRPHSRGSQSPMSVSRAESLSGEPVQMFSSLTQDDLERSFMLSPGGHKTSLYESLRQSGAATLLENLQSQLKQREGEIVQLRSEIQQLERTRESMARELVNLTNQNEELQARVEELPEMKNQLEGVNQRYDALLQMYGEKVEEADELRLDLQDVKEMYKTQIDHLLAK